MFVDIDKAIEPVLSGNFGPLELMAAFLGGALLSGLFLAMAVHFYSLRIFRWRVLDEVRRELRDPLNRYVEWLHAVSAEFSVWKNGFLLRYAANNPLDQQELNRLRRLFIDARGQSWFNRLEEYEPVLGRFRKAAKELWIRQAQIHEQFHLVFRQLEQNPSAASESGHSLENLAFAQSQLVSDFLYHLQYECLKAVADSKPKAGRGVVKPRLERTFLGHIRVAEPLVPAR